MRITHSTRKSPLCAFRVFCCHAMHGPDPPDAGHNPFPAVGQTAFLSTTLFRQGRYLLPFPGHRIVAVSATRPKVDKGWGLRLGCAPPGPASLRRRDGQLRGKVTLWLGPGRATPNGVALSPSGAERGGLLCS